MLNSFLLNSILLIFQVLHFSIVIVTLDLKSFLGHFELVFILCSLLSGKLELVVKLVSSFTNKFELMGSILFVLSHVVLLDIVQVNFVLLESVLFFVQLTSSSLNIIVDFVFVVLNSSFHLFVKLLLMKLILSSGFSHLV